ncbi:Alpha/Beta hydrolase protein [Roridomyces roridus]|uniref:Alpha/Beta hydrolase protein n=1 Tax=Roridomyces roridus TaxID=1738132 RepID=A0AAD7CG61_9AGAR|nr:Alpha/Beta hydrolase protein [Roridomyces roridus]
MISPLQMASISKFCASSDGTHIYAEASGNPANPSVVFVHGMLLSGIVFDKLFSDSRMLDKLYLVRYDVRGHGRSGKPTVPSAYTSAMYADDFAAVAREFSLNNPVYVGWSAGAPVASDICTNIAPVPLGGVIAMSGALCVSGAAQTLKPKLVELFPKLFSSDTVTALNARVSFADAAFLDPENVSFSVKAAWIGSTVMQTPDIFKAIRGGHKPDQTKIAELGARGFPAMVIYGTEDQIQDGRIVAAHARPHFTNLEVLTIEGGSHSLFYDNLDETVESILPFCLRFSGKVNVADALKKLGGVSYNPVLYRTPSDSVDLQTLAIVSPLNSHLPTPDDPQIVEQLGQYLGGTVEIRLYERFPRGAHGQILIPSSSAKHYMVLNGMTPDDGAEDMFNDWYTDEHIPMLSAVPGWRSSSRFRLLSSSPSSSPPLYLALHEWASREAFGTSQFKAATNTPWRTRVVVEKVHKKERRLLEYLGTVKDLEEQRLKLQ